SQRRRVGLEKRKAAAAGDSGARRLQSRRGQKHVLPSRTFGDDEAEQGGEPLAVNLGVVFEHNGEIETLVDDAPPGSAMAEEGADLPRSQREGIAGAETRGCI